MDVFRAEIHGHFVEVRIGAFGGRRVLVGGRIVYSNMLAGLWDDSQSQFLDLVDEQGKSRRVEVRVVQPARGLGLMQRVRINVDGVERAWLEPLRANRRPSCCVNCGYNLQGLIPENGEVKCPECGRHTSASSIASG